MSNQKLIDAKFKQAEKDGVFKNLPGSGKPINTDDYFKNSPHLRMAYSMLKGAGYIPEEIMLKKEIEEIQQELKDCSDNKKRESLRKKLLSKSNKYNFLMDVNRSFLNRNKRKFIK